MSYFVVLNEKKEKFTSTCRTSRSEWRLLKIQTENCNCCSPDPKWNRKTVNS